MPNDNLVVIAAMARKGGSGKTTLSRALISAAVAAGRRVLLIDTDRPSRPEAAILAKLKNVVGTRRFWLTADLAGNDAPLR